MAKKEKGAIILQNTKGKDVDPINYFFSDGSDAEKEIVKKFGSIIPPYFNQACGKPVDREELIEVFDKIFDPEKDFLFYKTPDKEVYLVIVPLKYSEVDTEHGALPGDFQKHAISFVSEGSVNLETLKTKLKRVATSIAKANK